MVILQTFHIFRMIFVFCSCTAAAVYSSQSESIKEDLPVLQRLCQAAVLQNRLMKKQCSFIVFFFFFFKPMYTSAGVVMKYLATTLGYLQFSCSQLFCGCSERCLWVVMDIWELVRRPDWTVSQGAKIKRGTIKVKQVHLLEFIDSSSG